VRLVGYAAFVLSDDTVRAERWALGFSEEGVYTLNAALRDLRCGAGRGHDDFSAELCSSAAPLTDL
jgi:hypothetical protein